MSTTQSPWRLAGTSRVVQAGLLLILGQLAFRGWANYSAWFTYDDFNFFSRLLNDGAVMVTRAYGGHLMPGGMSLSWLAAVVAPYDYRVLASMLLLMQVLADVGMLVLLVRMFGPRVGILPPLALYLFTVSSVPMAVWWAAGVNQIPFQIVLFWALASHVSYLRTRRLRHLWHTLAWLLAGLAFYEKTILVLGALLFVGLAYFTSGGPGARLVGLWKAYRPAVIVYALLAISYAALYAVFGLNFSPGSANSPDLWDVTRKMAGQAYAPSVLGGPLRWMESKRFFLPDPGSAIMLLSAVVMVLVGGEIRRARTRSLRAWLLPAFFLLCDIILVAAGRASFVGSLISLDYRYQSELSAVTAIALACATMTILGAVETSEPRASSELLDHPRRVAIATSVVACLGLVSSYQYVRHWNETLSAEPYFTRLIGSLERSPTPVPLVDAPVPNEITLNYPESLLSHLLVPYAAHAQYLDVATDDLNVVASTGEIRPIAVIAVRRSLPGPTPSCGYDVRRTPVAVPLDGPVAFGGLWVRIGYLSSGDSPVRVTAGDVTRTTTVRTGLHALYFAAGDQFDSVVISGLARGVTLCTDDVTVGPVGAVGEVVR